MYYIHDHFKLSCGISNRWFGCIQRMAVTLVLQPGKKSDIGCCGNLVEADLVSTNDP